MSRTRTVIAALAAALMVAAVVALVVGVGHPGRSARPAVSTTSLAPFVAPSVAGAPSVANFCTVLAGDVGYLSELGHATTNSQAAAVLDRYVSAAPAIAEEAPAAIAGPARLYVAETSAIFGAMARSAPVNAALLRPYDTPAGQAAQSQVRAYAQAQCGFDLENPAAAAAYARR